MGAVAALEGQTGMLQLEITRGQIGPKDLEKVFAKLKVLCGTLYGVTSFAVNPSHRISDLFFSLALTLLTIDHRGRTKLESKRHARKRHASPHCRRPKTLGTSGKTQPPFPIARRPCAHPQRIFRRPPSSVCESTQRYQSMAHARQPYPMEKSAGRRPAHITERRKPGKRQAGIERV